jgi:hypothetical protein
VTCPVRPTLHSRRSASPGRLLDGEVGAGGRKPRETDDGAGILGAFAAQAEVCRLADEQLVVHALADRGRHHRAGAVEDAQQALSDTHFLAVCRQDLPDPTAHRGFDVGVRVDGELLLLSGELVLEVGDASLVLLDAGAAVEKLLANLVETLRRARKVVVAVADEQTLLRRIEFDLVAFEADLGGLDGQPGSFEIAFGVQQRGDRLRTRRAQLLRPLHGLMSIFVRRFGRGDLHLELVGARLELEDAAFLEGVALRH